MGEIYKVTNNVSGKIYIGKTKRKTRDRWLEHVRDAKNYPLKNIPLHKAIIKYGAENFQIETIETNVPEEELNYKEKYYIKKFNSTNSSIGYNATIGGDGGMVSSKLSEKDVNEIKLILSDKENIDSINKIAKQFNVTNTTIRAINDGKAWFDDSLSYPIRKYNTKTLGIERKIYEKIVNDLLNSDLQIYEIAKNNNVDTSCVYNINYGRNCYNGKNDYYKNIYSDNFPIRKIDNKVECDFNKAFYEVLFTNKSISQIERELNIHFNGLRYIVLGKRRRELTSDYITPMREHIEENKQIWIKQNGGKVNEICTSA